MASWSGIHTCGSLRFWLTGGRRLLHSTVVSSLLMKSAILALLVLSLSRLRAQDSVTVVPGARYEAGWVHRIFFGDHWRDAWTTPIRVPVLDLDQFAGGLTPVARGGGFQTKSLRLKGNDGKRYKFRSMDKDPAKVLPEELRESVAADIIQDQISSSNPFAQLVAVPLMNVVGVLNAEPRLFVLPDDEGLGEFRAEFGGVLGTIEEHPDESPEGERGFAGAEKVVGSYALLEKTEEDNRQRVDEIEYLKARLMDIYLGDWDRHPDQWRWAGFPAGDRWEWVPIPRDRDQVFSRFDGVLPWMCELAVPELTHFNEYYPQINDLTWTGHHLDRRFLAGLTMQRWDSLAAFLQGAIRDDVIAESVRRLPESVRAAEGPELEYALRKRRDNLPWASGEFYRLVTKYQDIHASDLPECARVVRQADGRVLVEISSRDPDTGDASKPPFYSRMFHGEETKEIRLLMHGGDDRVVVSGTADASPKVYVDGGRGNDELIDESSVNGWLLGVLPFFPVSRTKTFFYDSGKKTTFVEGSGTSIDRSDRSKPATEEEHWRPVVRDYGHDWKFGPWFSVAPDDGLFIGGGPILYEFGFRAEPYVYRMSLRAGYATALKRFRLDYSGEFYSLLKGARVSLHARASGIDVINYFGSGNETALPGEEEFYKIRQSQATIEPTLDFFPGKPTTVSFGIAVRHAHTELDSATYLGQSKPYGVDDISLIGLTARVTVDTRDNEFFPSRGMYLRGWSILAVPTWNNDYPFWRIGGEARGYLEDGMPFGASLAVRLMAEKLFGTYPYFEAAFLGGSPLLRGFERQRFAGDAMAVGNVEVRVPVTAFNVLVPGRIGVSGFVETGRVFARGESSRRWHSAAGGGVWISFVSREATLSVYVARSGESTGVYASAGFMF